MFKTLIVVGLLPFLFSGCDVEDDPELVRQLDETKAKIVGVETELEAVEAEIKEIRMTDPSEELPKIKVEVEKAVAQKAELEKQIIEIGEARKKAAEDLTSYQKKYRLR